MTSNKFKTIFRGIMRKDMNYFTEKHIFENTTKNCTFFFYDNKISLFRIPVIIIPYMYATDAKTT